MPHQLFLSHDSRDKRLADALAKAISRLTLGQLTVWHSSDSSGSGGLKPGHVWLDEVRLQLARSRAVVALLTPRSVARPWLLFESGFGAANTECDVIPVCVGIDNIGDVPFPLTMYQSYQLVDYESTRRFLEKLLPRYEIQFDEEMARPALTDLIGKLVDEPADEQMRLSSINTPSIDKILGDLKTHIDKRVLEVVALNAPTRFRPQKAGSYNIVVDLRAYIAHSTDQYLEVGSEMSVQDVLDTVFYLLPNMPMFKYLEKWMLRDTDADLNLVIREVGSRIPAYVIFKPNSHWKVVLLSKPYSPEDSRDMDRWYGRL